MDITTVLALIGALAPIITALGLLIKKTDQIHVLVNSNLTKVREDLAIALQQIHSANIEIKTLNAKLSAVNAKVLVPDAK